ncbi:uncharacterized protein [Rutidosis leptorrhynchoides]|uniref:uncharacterized protein n=1 Tax=Rutidosis leptorrhynchoides TaxID=125765 RepID=UPI003A9A1E4D
MEYKITGWNIRGLCTENKQDELRKFIMEEKLSSNSCRIVIGWDNNFVRVIPIHEDKQVLFCLIELRDLQTSFYGSFVLDEHSAGGSFLTEEMNEFNDCVDKLEVDDIGSTAFHYTWTISLRNPKCGVLKKLDRILVSEKFLSTFPQAYGRFLPYLISDHSPAVMGVMNGVNSPKKAFRFMNYVAYKDGFLDTVKEEWQKEIDGYAMFRVVKKLKNLKRGLKRLIWKNGNLHTKVEMLKGELQQVQALIDKNPYDGTLRSKAAKVLEEYEEAEIDELRKQKSRVDSICDESGQRYYDEHVAEQCVRHFQQFLGVSVPVRPIEELENIFTKS